MNARSDPILRWTLFSMTLELLLTEGLLLEKFSYFEYFIVSYAHAAIVPKYSGLKNMLKTIFFLLIMEYIFETVPRPLDLSRSCFSQFLKKLYSTLNWKIDLLNFSPV